MISFQYPVADLFHVTGQDNEIRFMFGKNIQDGQILLFKILVGFTANMVTSFTYDLTVVAAGSPQSGIKYLLKPQIGQSGADYKPRESKSSNGKPNDDKPSDGKPNNDKPSDGKPSDGKPNEDKDKGKKAATPGKE